MKAVNTSKGGRRKTSQAFRDLVIIFLAAILVYEVSFIYDLFEPLYKRPGHMTRGRSTNCI